MPNNRILAVDYGDCRTGFAISDEGGVIAQRLCTVVEKDVNKVAQCTFELIELHNVASLIVGLPRKMSGAEGGRCVKTRYFIGLVKGLTSIPVIEWDERLTTVSALRFLNEMSVTGKKRKCVVDQMAAQILLANYLEFLKLRDASVRCDLPSSQ